MPSPLVSCPSCNVHVRFNEDRCPHCGTGFRTCRAGARAAGAVLLGLTIAGCPSDDTSGESETMSSASATTPGGTTMDTPPVTDSTTDVDGTSVGPGSAYGVGETTDSDTFPTTETEDPETGSDTGSDTDTGGATDTGTDTGTTGISDTTTTGLEPDYGVPD